MTQESTHAVSRTESGARQWSKTALTRAHILRAAEEVFLERGYTNATVADVIDRAESSVGSIYHHFGGKAELFLALWKQFSSDLGASAARGVSKARLEGVNDPIELFEAGGIEYLRGIWRARRVAGIFWTSDAPPGFDDSRRSRSREWITNNTKLLGLGRSIEDQFIAAVFTSIMGEAARAIVRCTRWKQAKTVIDEAMRISRAIDLSNADR